MTIKEAIALRIARFDLLWLKAVGYTFQEEGDIKDKEYKEAMAAWKPKSEDVAKKHGFESFENYCELRYDEGDKVKVDEIEKVWDEKPVAPSPLYLYEMSVINEAERIANFIEKKAEEKGITAREVWDLYGKKDGEPVSCWDFVDNIKADGYDGWDDGHSGNSGSMAVQFTYTLLFDRYLFPYMHGALVHLVGDKGYYDDRSDCKEYIERFRKDEKN